MADEYPKACNVVVNGRVTPLVYPPGHLRHGEHIVFQNADEERLYDDVGVPASLQPEMIGNHIAYPVYTMPLDFGYERKKP